MKNTGFSLLEVLLSLGIFSTGLLGLLSMQTTSICTAYTALLHAQAQIQLISLAEQCLVTLSPDTNSWQNINQVYFPNNQSDKKGHHAQINWQLNNETGHLFLEMSC